MKLSWIAAFWALFLIFTLNLQAQKKSYPNELRGYEFYGRGRIISIELGESTKEDIEKVFGSTCTDKCELDEKWSIKFEYCGDFTRSIGNGKKMWDVTPKAQFIGKLYSTTLMPKSRISFDENDFSDQFVQGGEGASASHGERNVFYLVYKDEDGLSYKIFEKVAAKKDANTLLVNDSLTKGDLVEIRYEIPDKQQKQIW